jgi:DNA-binding transcriptional LysR family regulator
VPGFSSSRGVKHAYALTVRAERVLRELDTLLPKVEGLVRGEEFDPTRSQERFRLALTDNGATILLPSLVPILRRTAPGVTLVVSDLRPDTYEDVAAGRIDTALSRGGISRAGKRADLRFGRCLPGGLCFHTRHASFHPEAVFATSACGR